MKSTCRGRCSWKTSATTSPRSWSVRAAQSSASTPSRSASSARTATTASAPSLASPTPASTFSTTSDGAPPGPSAATDKTSSRGLTGAARRRLCAAAFQARTRASPTAPPSPCASTSTRGPAVSFAALLCATSLFASFLSRQLFSRHFSFTSRLFGPLSFGLLFLALFLFAPLFAESSMFFASLFAVPPSSAPPFSRSAFLLCRYSFAPNAPPALSCIIDSSWRLSFFLAPFLCALFDSSLDMIYIIGRVLSRSSLLLGRRRPFHRRQGRRASANCPSVLQTRWFSWRLGRSVLPRGELARRLIYDPGVRMRCELQRANGGGLQQEATSRVGRHRALRQHCVTSILAKLGVPGERAE
mmetsp:Transcript_37372/g.82233  ORF Transcript_37372/g.82233 Transcript_37372/m.82233 type:complete len:357 (+) Transcript_37372:248-1318(+)